MHFIEYIPAGNLDQFIKGVREDISFYPAGFPEFKVYSSHSLKINIADPEREYFIVKYIWPQEKNQKNLGFELYSNPERKELIDTILETGRPGASIGINISGEITKDPPSFVVYLPVYKHGIHDQSRQSKPLLGFVAAIVQIDELVKDALQRINRQPYIDLEIYHGAEAEENNLYYNDDDILDMQTHGEKRFARQVAMNIYGLSWILFFSAEKDFEIEGMDAYLPTIILFLGLFISVLISLSFLILAGSRNRALSIADTINQKYKSQQALSMRSDRLRSLGQMAAGIAHELNQPLVGVRGIAEHILIAIDRGWELTSEKIKGRVSQIIDQADRMTHIIDHVRIFAREAGKPEANSIDVNEVVLSCVNLLGAQFRSHGLTLEHTLATNLPKILANPFSLEEVILNLMINARDAVEMKMQKERMTDPKVTLKTKKIRKSKQTSILIQIEDNGTGIPYEIQDKIFDPFYTTKDAKKGTGLGLSISKSIIEEFNGELDVESTPGQGSVFTIKLNVETK
jgi:signal transduction histidine kinase